MPEGSAGSTSDSLVDCGEESSDLASAVPSLLARLKSPTPSDLVRKRKVTRNPPPIVV